MNPSTNLSTILPRYRAVAWMCAPTLALAIACAGGSAPTPSPTPLPGPNPTTGSNAPPAVPSPLVSTTWPLRTREHVDLWLHAYALLTRDTTLVPYFRRGYAESINATRRQRGVTSLLDTNRDRLLARLDVNPTIATSGQFLPLYFASWDQMRQAIDIFIRAGGNANATNDPTTRAYFAVLASAYQTAPDREWLRLFAEAVDDESRRFYHDYWTSQSRAHAGVLARTDSLWQRSWRPALQRFLNNTQQQNGELYLSAPLGGEGRTVKFGKSENAVAGPLPTTTGEADVVLYVMAHELAGTIASSAIEDNTTPAERRTGTTSRYEQSAAVRAGALLLERALPAALPGYMRFYLQTTGRATPPTDARTLFASTFAVPQPIIDAMARQLDVILGGI